MSEERLALQKAFIDAKLPKCKQFNKYGLTLVNTNAVIISSLMGELRNIILSFFKGGLYAIKKCEHCGTTTAKQYERAHCKGADRGDVALRALKRIRPDESAPLEQRDFMKAFVEEHATVPLWLLCKSCHTAYDKK
jgi:phage FluMu protein Com